MRKTAVIMAANASKQKTEVLSASWICYKHFGFSVKSILMLAVVVMLSIVMYITWIHYPKTLRKLVASQTVKFLRNDSDVTTPTIQGPVFMLIMINSIPKTAGRRQVLRETWAGTSNSKTPAKSSNTKNDIDDNLQVFCVFMVGISDNKQHNRELLSEAFVHGDILQIPTQESYRNMIKKIWAGFKWAQNINPRYLMKVDDDVYVDIPNLITWLHEQNLPKRLYTGWVLHRGRIMRKPDNQWYVSHSEFHEHYFPDYCIGPFYIFSGNLLEKLIKKTLSVKMFSVEDAYLGVLMRSLQIDPIYNNKIFLWDPSLVSKLPEWEDARFNKTICLGERLENKWIRFIHAKYKQIRPS